MVKGLVRTTLRIDNNLITRIELGYNSYIEKFDKYYEMQNKKIEREEEDEQD